LNSDEKNESCGFDYEVAFSRNIGWLTDTEQAALRRKRVAVAGLGGVGGSHVLTLARLGVGAFNLADFDTFAVANFNRQAGAMVSTLGRPKLDVIVGMARDINPGLDIRTFANGVSVENLDKFLDGVDIYVDGLDFFAFAARCNTFAACARRGVPAITSAPIGMGVAHLNFLPGRMTFEQYFRMEGLPEPEQALRFLLGLSPAMLHRTYLVDPSSINFGERRGPSTVMACQLCAGVAATESLKILLGRGKVIAAPRGLHFDAFRGKLAMTWRPGGNNNPFQRLALAIARRQLAPKAMIAAGSTKMSELRLIEQILDLARWAPSGDNTQPWRFEIVSRDKFIVRGFDTRDHCVYDLNGHPSQIAIGALLETLRIAASSFGLRVEVERLSAPETQPTFDCTLLADAAISVSPLFPYITVRAVQRRPMKTRPLSATEKRELEASVGANYRITWIEGLRGRLAAASLMFASAKIRLTTPEAFEVHRNVIEWGARFSTDKIPDQAVGLDPLTMRAMRWAMQDWRRIEFLNTYLGGTFAPRIQLDFIPGMACAAHFLIIAGTRPANVDDHVAAGGAMQRFWLTATRLGLQLQPEMTPLIFSTYAREGREFSVRPESVVLAHAVRNRLQVLLGANDLDAGVFMGRIGAGRAAVSRSTRLALDRLIVH